MSNKGISKRMLNTPLQEGCSRLCLECESIKWHEKRIETYEPGSVDYCEALARARYECANCSKGSYKFDNELDRRKNIFGGKRHKGKCAVMSKLYGKTIRNLRKAGLSAVKIADCIGDISAATVRKILKEQEA